MVYGYNELSAIGVLIMLEILDQQDFLVYSETFFFGDDAKNEYIKANINNQAFKYDGLRVITEKSIFGKCFFNTNFNGKNLKLDLTCEVILELNHDILNSKVTVKPKSVGNKWQVSFHSDEYDDFPMMLDHGYNYRYIEQYKNKDLESIESVIACIDQVKDAFIKSATATIQDQFNRHISMDDFMKLQRIIIGNSTDKAN
jgi:hypothetical protein